MSASARFRIVLLLLLVLALAGVVWHYVSNQSGGTRATTTVDSSHVTNPRPPLSDTASPSTTSHEELNPATAQAVFRQVSPSVFKVIAMDANGDGAQGSAVAVDFNEVVTNNHVARAGSVFKVMQGNNSWVATLLGCAPEHDLCRMKVDGLAAKPIPVRPSKTLEVGERVFAIGTPKGLELTLSDGLISALRPEEGAYLIQTTAPISPGSSGGGLFDARGNLVGITTFLIKEGQNLNFAVPGEWVLAVDAAARSPFPSAPSTNQENVPSNGRHSISRSQTAPSRVPSDTALSDFALLGFRGGYTYSDVHTNAVRLGFQETGCKTLRDTPPMAECNFVRNSDEKLRIVFISGALVLAQYDFRIARYEELRKSLVHAYGEPRVNRSTSDGGEDIWGGISDGQMLEVATTIDGTQGFASLDYSEERFKKNRP